MVHRTTQTGLAGRLDRTAHKCHLFAYSMLHRPGDWISSGDSGDRMLGNPSVEPQVRYNCRWSERGISSLRCTTPYIRMDGTGAVVRGDWRFCPEVVGRYRGAPSYRALHIIVLVRRTLAATRLGKQYHEIQFASHLPSLRTA